MKKMAVIQFGVLAVVSGIVTWLTFVTSRLARYHWKDISEGKAGLPTVTVFATKYGYLIPLSCCFASIIFIMIAFRRRNDSILLWWFTLIVIIELVGIAAISFFNMVPAIVIMNSKLM